MWRAFIALTKPCSRRRAHAAQAPRRQSAISSRPFSSSSESPRPTSSPVWSPQLSGGGVTLEQAELTLPVVAPSPGVKPRVPLVPLTPFFEWMLRWWRGDTSGALANDDPATALEGTTTGLAVAVGVGLALAAGLAAFAPALTRAFAGKASAEVT